MKCPDTQWANYLRGDRGIFTRRAVRLLDKAEVARVLEIYEEDGEFRETANRYIHDFEAMLRECAVHPRWQCAGGYAAF